VYAASGAILPWTPSAPTCVVVETPRVSPELFTLEPMLLYVGPTPLSLPRPLPALRLDSSLHPSCASRAWASTAGSSLVALEVSLLFVFVEAEGCFEAAALGLPEPKSPSFLRDSAASESEVTVPALSWIGLRAPSGSVVT
jgi:hypothetical protein